MDGRESLYIVLHLNSINSIASTPLLLSCFYALAISGCEGNSEATIRADCLPAGTFQYRSLVGAHHFYLCNYRYDDLRPREAPGSRGWSGQLWDLRQINAAFVQVCGRKFYPSFTDSHTRARRRVISQTASRPLIRAQEEISLATHKYFIRPRLAATILRHLTIWKINQHLFFRRVQPKIKPS